jgi:hypothetical protein
LKGSGSGIFPIGVLLWDLVVRDTNREIYSVGYEAVNAMLLNQFLKQYCKVEQLKEDFRSHLAEQQRRIEALTAGLQESERAA